MIKKEVCKCAIWGKRGIPIVNVNNITEETQLIIVIPIHDFKKIERMAKNNKV